jgi:RNAse (barnase) inhibitor barstar
MSETAKGSGFGVQGSGGDAIPAPSPALPPGFLAVDSPREFRDPAALVVRIPRGIRSKEKLFAIFAERLHFPRYFGWNWDALEELLRDLSWLPADKPIVIVHEDLPFGAGGENRDIYLNILRDVAAHWNVSQPGRLLVVLPVAAAMPN